MATKQASKMTKAAEKLKEKQRRGKPFKKGESGNLSGRPKGSKNYKTLAFEERLESLGCDPLKVLATICNNEREETNLRLAAAKELVGYVYPKRKSVELEHKGDLNLESALQKAHQRLKESRQNVNG